MLSIRLFVIILGILILFLFSTGIITYKDRGYDCYPSTSEKYRWGEKVRIVNIGNLTIHAQPLIKDCPVENQYDPATVDTTCGNYCIETGFDELQGVLQLDAYDIIAPIPSDIRVGHTA